MARKTKRPILKETLKLAKNHTWKAPKGYKTVVLDRGAVSFNIPDTWLLDNLEPVELYDKKPPDDNGRISVSFWWLPKGIDWSGLPIAGMLLDSVKNLDHPITSQTDIIKVPREDLELVWLEERYVEESRDAATLIAVARGWNVQVLITFDMWVDDRKKFAPVWEEALRSLQLGR